MSFEENLKLANLALEQLNNSDLSLKESIKLYQQGLENIKKARLELSQAKFEIEHIDE